MSKRAYITTTLILIGLLTLAVAKVAPMYVNNIFGQQTALVTLPKNTILAFRVNLLPSDSIFGKIIEPPFEALLTDVNIADRLVKANCNVVVSTVFETSRFYSIKDPLIDCEQTDGTSIKAVFIGDDGKSGSPRLSVGAVYRLKLAEDAEIETRI